MTDPATTAGTHPEHLRRRALRTTPGAPWVTYYDGSTQGRVELSAATLDNWVAKAGNLLVEEYDVGPGAVVGIDLACHWLLHVWTWSTWALGGAVALPAQFSRADVVITQGGRPSMFDPGLPVLACPTDPMARPLADRTAPGTADVMADIHTYPDAITLPSPEATAPALLTADGTLTGAEASAQAAALVPADARRVLVRHPPTDPASFLGATTSAATRGGSTVLIAGPIGADWLARIMAQEAVDVELRNHDEA